MPKIKSPTEFNSLLDLIIYFKDERTCLKYVEQVIWDGKPICPHCNHDKVYRFSDGKRFKCASCRKPFTVLVGSIFKSTKLPIIKWLIAMYLMANDKKGISSYQLARTIGITQSRAWYMLQKIRTLFQQEGIELSGVVEADETFVGGKNKNRHKNKKVKNSGGRSFKDKTPVLGLLESEIYAIVRRPHKKIPNKMVQVKEVIKDGKLICKVVPSTTIESLSPIVLNTVCTNSTLVTDEWQAYAKMGEHYEHEIVYHNKGQYQSSNFASTNSIEGHWSHLKRTLNGTYHNVSRKHLQKYADESTFRYNTKNKTEAARFSLLMSKITINGKS